MPQIIRPPSKTQIKVVPRDGELEITLNVNITVDGQVTAMAERGSASISKKDDDDKVDMMIPDFVSGASLSFGKDKEDQ